METPAAFEARNAPSSYPANTQEPNSCRTPSRESGQSGLARVREAAKKDRKTPILIGALTPNIPTSKVGTVCVMWPPELCGVQPATPLV